MEKSCSPELAVALSRWFKGDTERFQPFKGNNQFKKETLRLLSMKDTFATGIRHNKLYRVLKLDVNRPYDAVVNSVHFSSTSVKRFASFTQRLDLAEDFYRKGGSTQGKHGVVISLDLRLYDESPIVFSWMSALLATRSYPTIRQQILNSGKELKEFVLFFSDVPMFKIEKILPPQ